MPPDNAILEELKEMSQEEQTIPAKHMNRLILAGMVALSNQLEALKTSQEQVAPSIIKALEPIKKNPMVAAGDFIAAHPKLTVGIVIFILAMSNIWFIDSVRYGVLVWLKVPEEIIKLLVHGG
jgi:hypothetical protein